jgi:hypothetical protein
VSINSTILCRRRRHESDDRGARFWQIITYGSYTPSKTLSTGSAAISLCSSGGSLLVGFSLASPVFLSAGNFANIGRQTALVSVMAVGAAFVIISSEIDLSAGANLALSGMVGAIAMQSVSNHLLVGTVAAVGTGMAVGLPTRSARPSARSCADGSVRSRGLNRHLRVTKSGLLRIDKTKINTEAALDGKYLLRTSDLTIPAEDIARGYKALADVERGWRDMKQLELRPIYHRQSDRIVGHVQLCWLALLLTRIIENQVGDTWRNISAELERMYLITLRTATGCVSQRTRTSARQRQILDKLDLPEPPRYFEFTPTGD